MIHFNITRISALKSLCLMLMMLCAFQGFAASQSETLLVGETKTLYLPSSVTSLNLKSVSFYSNGINYVQVQSYNNYSVTVKAIKEFSAPILVRCDYRYFINNGGYTYETSGYYDFQITVVGNGNSGGASGVQPTRIYFPNSAVGIDVGETRQLEPVIEPANADCNLTWSINDSSVASISQDGVLTGKKAGTADLTVKAQNGVYAMLRVVVSQGTPLASSVSVSPSSVTLKEGEYKYLSATVYPSQASQHVVWSSSNTVIASVSASGKVTANKAGSCTITATTDNGKKSSCTVTVTPVNIEATSILLPETVTIQIGECITLAPVVLPSNANYSLIWVNYDSSVVSMSLDGTICGLKAGSARIRARVRENELYAECLVTVVDPQPELPEEPETTWQPIVGFDLAGTHTIEAEVDVIDGNTADYPESFRMTIGNDGQRITEFLLTDNIYDMLSGLKIESNAEGYCWIQIDDPFLGYNTDGSLLYKIRSLNGSDKLMFGQNADGLLTLEDFAVEIVKIDYNSAEIFSEPITGAYYRHLTIKAEYGPTSSITRAEDEKQIYQLSIDGNTIRLSEKYQMILVDLNGKTIYSGITDCISNIPAGFYIIKTGNICRRIRIR